MMKIEMYSSAHCSYCDQAKALFERKGVTCQVIRVDLESGELDKMLVRSGGKRSVPQIFINDVHIGGCDDLYALEQQGKLDELLVSE